MNSVLILKRHGLRKDKLPVGLFGIYCVHNKGARIWAMHRNSRYCTANLHSAMSVLILTMDLKFLLYLLYIVLPSVKCAVPGTFFWRPRLGLDLSIPTTDISIKVNLPSKENIQEGLVLMIEGYQVGKTVVSLAAGISNAMAYPPLNPLSAYFYTNAYRWALRHFSLLPKWIGGGSGSYCDTHKVWRRRFFYMDEFVPVWMRRLFPFVSDKEWKKEEMEFKLFKKYSEPAFGKHYRYPSKVFNNFASQETKESTDVVDPSSSSEPV